MNDRVPCPSPTWGPTCNRFLKSVKCHPSKASRGYYYKNHVQYFDAVFRSLIELKRVLAPRARCVLVLQDSYYKDVHNDLPRVFIEMGHSVALRLTRRDDFALARTMAQVNPAARRYRSSSPATESVLCFSCK